MILENHLFTTMKILIAEDNLMNQHLMSRYMSKLGWEFLIVDNGLQAITAYADDQMRTECAEAGMNAFIAKPCSRDEINEVITECVEISLFRVA